MSVRLVQQAHGCASLIGDLFSSGFNSSCINSPSPGKGECGVSQAKLRAVFWRYHLHAFNCGVLAWLWLPPWERCAHLVSYAEAACMQFAHSSASVRGTFLLVSLPLTNVHTNLKPQMVFQWKSNLFVTKILVSIRLCFKTNL